MTEEEISEVLPSIALARLFYEYGKLDAMLNAGFDTPDSELYEDILRRELSGLDEEFESLRLLSQELSLRARGIRSRKAA